MLSRRMKWCLAIVLSAMLGCNNGNWSSGDRVLVEKFPYDCGTGAPRRFDVVVFKYPEAPIEKGVPKNYIKRLMGLPGQILAIFFGQLFFYIPLPNERPRDNPQIDDVDNPNINAHDLWKKRYMHTDDARCRELFLAPSKFEIVRKPPEVMMAMRRLVYDNDFQAKDLVGKLPPRWQPGQEGGWANDKNHGFIHAGGGKKNEIDWLRYQHILRPWNWVPGMNLDGRKKELISDFMDYNYGEPGTTSLASVHSSNWVGDLMLECELTVNKAEGEFWLELSKSHNRFQARFDLASGKCTLFKLGKNGKKNELAQADTRVKSPGVYNIRLANFDCRLTVWVDGDLPFGDGADYPPPALRAPDEDLSKLSEDEFNERNGPSAENDLEPASIGNTQAQVHVNHIRLWRDTYYLCSADHADVPEPLNEDFWYSPDEFYKLRGVRRDVAGHRAQNGVRSIGMPFVTMYTQPGHYLCLGDNSPASSDSRQWGTVPHRLMLGRALMVYFPLDRAGAIR